MISVVDSAMVTRKALVNGRGGSEGRSGGRGADKANTALPHKHRIYSEVYLLERIWRLIANGDHSQSMGDVFVVKDRRIVGEFHQINAQGRHFPNHDAPQRIGHGCVRVAQFKRDLMRGH
jgi:hypothetical protein